MSLPIDEIIKAAKKVFARAGREVEEEELKNIAKNYKAGTLKQAEDRFGKGYTDEEIVPLIQELDSLVPDEVKAAKALKVAEPMPEVSREQQLEAIRKKYEPQIKRAKDEEEIEKGMAKKRMQEEYAASKSPEAAAEYKRMKKLLESRFTKEELDSILKKYKIGE